MVIWMVEFAATLTAQRSTGKITLDSWLQNELDIEFIGGYLLYIDPRLSGRDGGVPQRISGMDRRTDRAKYYDSEKVPAAVNVLAVKLPPLRAEERVSRLGFDEYAEFENQHYRWANRPEPNPKTEPMLPTLRYSQFNDWAGSLDIAGGDLLRPDAAALMASTRNMYLHNSSLQRFRECRRSARYRRVDRPGRNALADAGAGRVVAVVRSAGSGHAAPGWCRPRRPRRDELCIACVFRLSIPDDRREEPPSDCPDDQSDQALRQTCRAE